MMIVHASSLASCMVGLVFSFLQQPSNAAASRPAADRQSIRDDLKTGRADDAISKLNPILLANPRDAEAHNLLCRVLYQEKRWDEAIHECEAAAGLSSRSGEFHLWLARAYGQKADSIHSIKAYGLAKKVKEHFETAVQLDGRNADALSDLGEFYVTAPGIVGGDKRRAGGVAQTLAQVDPARSHELNALIAEKEKNAAVAEQELKTAIEVSKEPASAWVGLAAFYARSNRNADVLQSLKSAIDSDEKSSAPGSAALVDAASLLTRTNQDPQLAIRLLRLYLDSSNKSEDAPAFQVHIQLSSLLARQGDEAGARQQVESAAALASAYRPAAR